MASPRRDMGSQVRPKPMLLPPTTIGVSPAYIQRTRPVDLIEKKDNVVVINTKGLDPEDTLRYIQGLQPAVIDAVITQQFKGIDHKASTCASAEADNQIFFIKYSFVKNTNYLIVVDNRPDDFINRRLKEGQEMPGQCIDSLLGTSFGDRYCTKVLGMLSDDDHVVIDNRPDPRSLIGSPWPRMSLQEYYNADRISAQEVKIQDVVAIGGRPCCVSKSHPYGPGWCIKGVDLFSGAGSNLDCSRFMMVYKAHVAVEYWAVEEIDEDSKCLGLVNTDQGRTKQIEAPSIKDLVPRIQKSIEEFGPRTTVTISKALMLEGVTAVQNIIDLIKAGTLQRPIGDYELDVADIKAKLAEEKAKKKRKFDEDAETKRQYEANRRLRVAKRHEEAARKRHHVSAGALPVRSPAPDMNSGQSSFLDAPITEGMDALLGNMNAVGHSSFPAPAFVPEPCGTQPPFPSAPITEGVDAFLANSSGFGDSSFPGPAFAPDLYGGQQTLPGESLRGQWQAPAQMPGLSGHPAPPLASQVLDFDPAFFHSANPFGVEMPGMGEHPAPPLAPQTAGFDPALFPSANLFNEEMPGMGPGIGQWSAPAQTTETVDLFAPDQVLSMDQRAEMFQMPATNDWCPALALTSPIDDWLATA